MGQRGGQFHFECVGAERLGKVPLALVWMALLRGLQGGGPWNMG